MTSRALVRATNWNNCMIYRCPSSLQQVLPDHGVVEFVVIPWGEKGRRVEDGRMMGGEWGMMGGWWVVSEGMMGGWLPSWMVCGKWVCGSKNNPINTNFKLLIRQQMNNKLDV